MSEKREVKKDRRHGQRERERAMNESQKLTFHLGLNYIHFLNRFEKQLCI